MPGAWLTSPLALTAANRRLYWDEIYLFITCRIIFDGICKPIAWFDRHINRSA